MYSVFHLRRLIWNTNPPFPGVRRPHPEDTENTGAYMPPVATCLTGMNLDVESDFFRASVPKTANPQSPQEAQSIVQHSSLLSPFSRTSADFSTATMLPFE